MAFQQLVRTNVRRAFNIIGDLATDVTLVQSNASEFDFEFGETVEGAQSTSVVKGVLIRSEKTPEDNSSITGELYLIAEDVTDNDPSVYDTATIDGVTWKINSYRSNQYLIIAQVSRER